MRNPLSIVFSQYNNMTSLLLHCIQFLLFCWIFTIWLKSYKMKRSPIFLFEMKSNNIKKKHKKTFKKFAFNRYECELVTFSNRKILMTHRKKWFTFMSIRRYRMCFEWSEKYQYWVFACRKRINQHHHCMG